MNDLINKIVKTYLAGKDEVANIEGLYGDASYRRYFRARLGSGASIIVMKLPEGISSASEEITNYEGPKDELPYINVSRFLSSRGVSVPKILFYDRNSSAILLEDLGDGLLYDLVAVADEETKEKEYKKAIDLLISLENATLKEGDCIAYKRSFDETLLNWEFDHFLEFGIEARLNIVTDAKFKGEFKELARAITARICAMPYRFTHRDFQSRNIMPFGGKQYLIDFQDALMGPYCYDLVALLRDSYIDIDFALLDRLIGYYCAGLKLDKSSFSADFHLMTVQRKLKDAGRFVYIEKVKKNPNYLKFIPRTLDYVKGSLSKVEGGREMKTLLARHLKEFS